MIIQASHMNYSLMSNLRAQQEQVQHSAFGASLLQDSAASRLASGMNIDERAGLTPPLVPQDQLPAQQTDKPQPHASEAAPQTIGAAVANEVIRRLEASDGESGQAGNEKDSSDLRHSLGQTLDWVRERFGDDTATAAAGMVMAATSDGVTEESLGEGLLDAAKFIDRNFGIAAGDATLAKFNSNVNVELNNYFDNGSYETFHAETVQSGGSETQAIASRFFARAVQASDAETVDPGQQLLEELNKELEETAELQNLTSQLEAKFNPAKATAQQAAAAYSEPYAPVEPQFADVAV